MLTRGDVCHLHADRGAAERCGALIGGVPDRVRLEEAHRAGVPGAVVSVGCVRRRVAAPAPPAEPVGPFNGPRLREQPCLTLK